MRIFEKKSESKIKQKKERGKKKPGKDFSRARGAEHTPKGYEKNFSITYKIKKLSTNPTHPFSRLFHYLPFPGKIPRKQIIITLYFARILETHRKATACAAGAPCAKGWGPGVYSAGRAV